MPVLLGRSHVTPPILLVTASGLFACIWLCTAAVEVNIHSNLTTPHCPQLPRQSDRPHLPENLSYLCPQALTPTRSTPNAAYCVIDGLRDPSQRDSVSLERPNDSYIRIVPDESALLFGGIKISNFVDDIRRFGSCIKPVRESLGDPDHAGSGGRKPCPCPFAKR